MICKSCLWLDYYCECVGYHFYSFVYGVVSEVVCTDQRCSIIKPLDYKDVSVVTHMFLELLGSYIYIIIQYILV